jgi:hypothetical protein
MPRSSTIRSAEAYNYGLDLSRAKRTNEAPRRVNVNFPAWMIHSLDKEAGRLGVTRQSIIKVWISERLGRRSA